MVRGRIFFFSYIVTTGDTGALWPSLSPANLARSFGTSNNLTSSACFSSCSASRLPASSSVLYEYSVSTPSDHDKHGKQKVALTKHNSLGHQIARSCGGIARGTDDVILIVKERMKDEVIRA